MIFTLFAFAGWIVTLLFCRREIADHRATLERSQMYLNEHKAFREAAMRVIKDQADNIRDLKEYYENKA